MHAGPLILPFLGGCFHPPCCVNQAFVLLNRTDQPAMVHADFCGGETDDPWRVRERGELEELLRTPLTPGTCAADVPLEPRERFEFFGGRTCRGLGPVDVTMNVAGAPMCVSARGSHHGGVWFTTFVITRDQRLAPLPSDGRCPR